MGMLGYYTAIEDSMLQQIMHGELDILRIDPRKYPTLEIDKSWQAIHYLLCQVPDQGEPPMGYVVPLRDEQELDCELDYGASYLTAQQVKEASDFLTSLDDGMLKDRYDFQSMQAHQVYPLYGMKPEDAEVFYQYLYSNVMELKTYFQEIAEKGYAIIFHIM